MCLGKLLNYHVSAGSGGEVAYFMVLSAGCNKTKEDVLIDCFSPMTSKGSQGLRKMLASEWILHPSFKKDIARLCKKKKKSVFPNHSA